MKKIITMAACMCISAFVTLSAQNNLNDPFGIGISTPHAQLHIHQTQAEDPVPPIIPPYEGNRNQVFDDTYNTTFLMTNPNSGSTSTDGFLLQQQNWDIRFLQREHGYMLFQTPGGRMILSATGRFGHGDTVATHAFNVQGTARFGSNVKMSRSLTVDSSITVGGTLYANGIIYATFPSYLNSTLDVGGATHIYAPLTVLGATTLNGTLSVGSGFQCDAQGNLRVKHLKVTLTGWPDYVFGGNHTLMPLNELEAYVNEHSHLPGVPSAEEVEEQGADLGEMNKLLVEKVEELTLYIIDLQKQINELKSNR